MKSKATILIMVVILLSLGGLAWADTAVPVSPSGTVGQSCPTFSWSSAPGATSYMIEVYEQVTDEVIERASMGLMENLVVALEIPAPALSWSASSGECLTRGMGYVWYVKGVDAEGEGRWSGGMGFKVDAAVLSIEQQEEVKEVVRETLKEASDAGSTVSETANTAVKADVIVPMTLPAEISAYGNATSTVLGVNAGISLDLGSSRYDTFIGASAGASNTTGSHNAFVGYLSGYSNDTGGSNTFFGDSAGYGNKGGSSNAFVGRNAGYSNTTGYNNAFVGDSAGYKNGAGNSNIFVGRDSGYSNTTGSHNTFVGIGAGYYNTAQGYNVFVGNYAGHYNTKGYNVFIGYDAGYDNVDGDGNVFIGYSAGESETGSNKLYIDNCATGYTPGTGGWCTQPLIYGEFDNRVVKIDGRLELIGFGTASDIRYKKEIHTLDSPLEKVLKLEGVTYEWDKEKVKGAGFEEGRQIGLIAQEVEKVLPELVHTDSKGYKTLSYDKLGPVLIEAVKEMKAQHDKEMKEKNDLIAKVEQEIGEKNSSIERLEKQLEEQKRTLASVMARLASLENPTKTIALK